MPIRFDEHQAKVSCAGDIEVLSFPPSGPDGAAWLTLAVGEPGEPGRPQEDLSPRDLNEHRGVVIGFKDPRSIDVFIEALQLIRADLVDQRGAMIRASADIDRQEEESPPVLTLTGAATHHIKGRGMVKVCTLTYEQHEVLRDLPFPRISGAKVDIDGELFEVRGEEWSTVAWKKTVGLMVRPWGQDAAEREDGVSPLVEARPLVQAQQVVDDIDLAAPSEPRPAAWEEPETPGGA